MLSFRNVVANSLRTAASALAVAALFGSAACATKSLHPSYGLRFNDVFHAQAAIRATKDVSNRGEEAARVVGAYYESFTPEGGAPAASGGGPVMPSTAGVRPLN